MLLATTLVTLVPALCAWWLRNHGVLGSAFASLLFCILLSLGLSALGAAYWKRRRSSADIMFSELLVWGWIRRLRRERRLRDVPALVASAVNDQGSDQQAVDRRRRMLAQLAAAIEAKDPYIDGHSRRVARHAEMIATEMKLPAEQVARIRAAGALHDVGKLSTPSEVLSKPGRLTDQEFEVVKRHAREGAAMVTCLEDPELTAIVGCHHERLDGSGYPDGLAAAQIPVGARIVAVADVFDAITAPRPYRPAASHQRAFAVLSGEEGARLDPEAVEAFIRCYSGRSTVALWGALSALLVSGFARTKGVLARRRLSPRDLLNTAAAVSAAAAAAVAAPLSSAAPNRRTPDQPAAVAAATNLQAPVAHKHHREARHHHATRHRRAAAAKPAAVHRFVTRTVPTSTAPTTSSAPRVTPAKPKPQTRAKPPAKKHTPVPQKTRPTAAPPTTTTIPATTTTPVEPTSKQQCMDGGYVSFGFPNQGQCIDWVVHNGG